MKNKLEFPPTPTPDDPCFAKAWSGSNLNGQLVYEDEEEEKETGEEERKPRNRNETQPSKRVPGRGRRTSVRSERQKVSLPSRGSQSHRGDEQINASTGNREAWAAAGLDS